MTPQISVIICTHNPKEDYLSRTLDALEQQTLTKDEWELLLIDNASNKFLSNAWDLSWHPLGRHIREDELGLTPARLRGIREAHGELLVFVDDDNLLAPEYLEMALRISSNHSFLGAWGGTLLPEFETEPPEWAKPHVHMLAIRDVVRCVWSNMADWSLGCCPAGAGMCIRASVAREYLNYCRNDPKRAGLDRKGHSLVSCGDLDMAFTACDMGMGTGLFPELCLTHIIPKGRLELDYLLRLGEANGASTVLLKSFREKIDTRIPDERVSTLRKIKIWINEYRHPKTEYQRIQEMFGLAFQTGWKNGIMMLKEIASTCEKRES